MLLAQLETFVEIVRQGTMRRAGESLHLGQPALSARLRGLERELGVALFERRKSGLQLTPIGRSFLPYAERALDAVRTGATLARDMERGEVGHFVVGAVPSVSAYVLPELIARFRGLHPSVRIHVRTARTEEIRDLVVAGEADIGLVRELTDKRLVIRPLFGESLVLTVPVGHDIARSPSVSMTDLQSSVIILYDRTGYYYHRTQALFRAAMVTPREVIEVDNPETAKRMVQRGIGISFLQSTAISDSIIAGEFAAITVTDAAPIRSRIVSVRRVSATQSTALTDFELVLGKIPALIGGATELDPAGRHRPREGLHG